MLNDLNAVEPSMNYPCELSNNHVLLQIGRADLAASCAQRSGELRPGRPGQMGMGLYSAKFSRCQGCFFLSCVALIL